jgi:glycerol-3-phosphate acyltransferase PlsY
LYPVFLRFKGGKGVATALGVFLALAPWATLVLILVFAAVLLAARAVSLSSMIAAAAAPLVLWLSSHPPTYVWMSFLIAAMIVLRHRKNIERLLSGNEPKLGAASSR